MTNSLNPKRVKNTIALLSTIPLTLAIQMVDTPLNWGMYVLVFLSCMEDNLKTTIKRSTLIGSVTALINFSWIISSTNDFAGKGGFFLGLLIMLGFCIAFVLYANIIGVLYATLRWHNRENYSWVFNSILAGCLFTGLDLGMTLIGQGFSTCMYLNFISLAHNQYAIQPTAFVSPYFLSFLIGATNFQAAYFIYHRKYKLLSIPVAIILIYLGIGSVLLYNYNKTLEKDAVVNNSKRFKAALICENILPKYKWDSQNGFQLVNNLFSLNKKAIASGANLAIWSETAIPWTYQENDDFIGELNKQCTAANMSFILGINTQYQGNVYYNSMYSYAPNAQLLGRYDKRQALFLVEKPFMGIVLPFFINSASYLVKESRNDTPLRTQYGYAGMLLCNESAIGLLAAKSVRLGANFLINSGNDGWFANTYITKQHFYYARLRAVENRKDILINNNNGYSGMVRSNGDIVGKEQDDFSTVLTYDVMPNSYLTPVSQHYYTLMFYFCLVLFIVIEIFNIKRNKHSWDL